MKTSITARLNYRADSEGCHALIIQVIHHRRRSILTTPYRLRPEEFDAKSGRAVAVNRTKSRRTLIREANECVALCTEELRAACARLAASGKPYTASDITGAYRSGSDNRYVEAFAKQLASDLEEAGRFGTARSYRSLASAWSKFAAQSRYRFSQLDEHTVFAFGEYLFRRGNRRNTVSFYLRTLHALYNRARRCGYAPTHGDPVPGGIVQTGPNPETGRTPKPAANPCGQGFRGQRTERSPRYVSVQFLCSGDVFRGYVLPAENEGLERSAALRTPKNASGVQRSPYAAAPGDHFPLRRSGLPVGAALHAARNALFGEQTGRCERRRAACVAV